MKKGDRLRMKRITPDEISSMNLGWMWNPGEIVTYARKIIGAPYDAMVRGKPACLVDTHTGRRIWVYNEYLETPCIWL